MQIGCTEMHPIVLGVIVIELIMFGALGTYYLERPMQSSRIWYLLFLALLLTLNIINGFLPNPALDIPLYIQYIFRNGIGFLTISYFPFLFFKKLQIISSRVQEKTVMQYLLIIPYPIIFFVAYATFNDLEKAHRYTIFIPCLNNVVMIVLMAKTIWNIYSRNTDKKGSPEEILAFIMLITWLSIYPAIHLNWGKTTEIICINFGPAVFNILLLYNRIKTMRYEQADLDHLNPNVPLQAIITLNCSNYLLSERETEVAILLCHRLKRQQIADKLFISVRTVDKHIERIFLKAGVSSRENLLEKLNNLS